MRTRPLGATGLHVSEVGLGAWQLGNADWDGPDARAAVELVHEALRLRCTLFDTAPGYGAGTSEELLGRALETRRDDVVLVSKFGHTTSGGTYFSPQRVRPALEETLGRLRTDRLDVFLLHNPPGEMLDGRHPVYPELDRLRDEGLISAYGASVDWQADV